MARLFVEVLFNYRDLKNYWLYKFVLMPDHFHLLISPTLSLERSLQLNKGGFLIGRKKNWDLPAKYGRRVSTTVEFPELKTITTSNNISGKIQSSRAWLVSSPIIPTVRRGQNLRWTRSLSG